MSFGLYHICKAIEGMRRLSGYPISQKQIERTQFFPIQASGLVNILRIQANKKNSISLIEIHSYPLIGYQVNVKLLDRKIHNRKKSLPAIFGPFASACRGGAIDRGGNYARSKIVARRDRSDSPFYHVLFRWLYNFRGGEFD